MALLFAADRLDHVEAEIEPLLQQGICVISDRYYHSSVAYQALTSSSDLDSAIAWIRTLNARARRPDLTIVVDVTAEQAGARRRARGSTELYETDILQAQLVDFYGRLEQYFEGEAIVHVDGSGSVEQVAGAILAQLAMARLVR
jgi:dTMP kinase